MSLFTNPKRAKQLLDFSGLKTPNSPIFPTDIDGLIELWDKGYFIIEIKYARYGAYFFKEHSIISKR